AKNGGTAESRIPRQSLPVGCVGLGTIHNKEHDGRNNKDRHSGAPNRVPRLAIISFLLRVYIFIPGHSLTSSIAQNLQKPCFWEQEKSVNGVSTPVNCVSIDTRIYG